MRVVLPLPQPENSASPSSPSSRSTGSEQQKAVAVEKSVLEDKSSSKNVKSITSSKQKKKLKSAPKRESKVYRKSDYIRSEKQKSAVSVKKAGSICSLSTSNRKHIIGEAEGSRRHSNSHPYSFSIATGDSKSSVSSFSSSSSSRKRKNPSSASDLNLKSLSEQATSASKKLLKTTQGPQERSSLSPSMYTLKCGESSNDTALNISSLHQETSPEAHGENYCSVQEKVKSDCLQELSRYEVFQKLLKERKLEMVEQEGDGNCLFRAVSLQVFGDPEMHSEVRRKCLDFMAKEEGHFSQFIIDEPFQDYIQRKRIDGVHGNNPEIQAISELFNRPVEVFVPENGAKPLNIFHAEYKTSDAPIRLSYHDGNHYNAVIDPLYPTAGLGLGLPGLQPGLADKMQLQEAVKENLQIQEKHQFEKVKEESMQYQMKMAMIESAKYNPSNLYEQKTMVLSDIEGTDFELEQLVLANSLKSYQNSEKVRKGPGNSKRRTKNNTSPLSLPNSNSSIASASIPAASSFSTQPTTWKRNVAASSNAASVNFHAQAQVSQEGEEEYPQVVQELVMNGFELSNVLHAYDLVGNNFDDLLCFLMSTGR